jgi:hypothetical protein
MKTYLVTIYATITARSYPDAKEALWSQTPNMENCFSDNTFRISDIDIEPTPAKKREG